MANSAAGLGLGQTQWLTLFASAPLRVPTSFGTGVFHSSSHERKSSIGWIRDIAHLADAGYVHIALFAVSLVWTVTAFGLSGQSKSKWIPRKAPKISKLHEFLSQASRVAALVCLAVASTSDHPEQWYNVILVAFALGFGLVRFVNNRRLRRVSLHQANFLTCATLLLLLASKVLPMAEIGARYRPSNISIAAMLCLSAACLSALTTPRERSFPDFEFDTSKNEISSEPSPEEVCSWWTKYLTYGFLTSMIWKGCRGELNMDDLPSLAWYDEPLLLLSKVQHAREKSKSTAFMLLRFLHVELSLMFLYTMISHTAELVAPLATYQLLAYISDPETARLSPYVWLVLLFLGPMLQTVTFQQYIFVSTRLIVRTKAGLTQELYHRAMSSMELDGDILSTEKNGTDTPKKQTTHSGQLQNLMSGDIDAITNARDIIMMGIGGPWTCIIAFVGLYKIMGWPALVGIGLLIISVPVPAYVAKLMGNSQREAKAAQDARISLSSEYLGSVRTIKYFAWEEAMAKIIAEARSSELKAQWRISLLWVVVNIAAEIFPCIALVTMFALHTTVLSEPLTAQVAFTTLLLVNIMRGNIVMLGMFSRTVVNAKISIERLDKYFNNTKPLLKHPEGPLRMANAAFRRNPSAEFTLKNLSIDFVNGGLNTIEGVSGSGKTTLLLSILGETTMEGGEVTRPHDVGFSSQTAWLQNATIRDNILFASDYDDVRYNRIINACGLAEDLSEFANGDETEIGENGTSLSGGQKARLSLARALYSKAPLLLLDDIFSALDTKTAAHIWESCFCSELLHGRTVVLVTQLGWIAEQSDLAIKLSAGEVIQQEQHLGITRRPVHSPDANESGSSTMTADQLATSNLDNTDKAEEAKLKKQASNQIDEESKATGKTGRLSFFQYMMYFGGVGYAVFAIFTSFICIAFSLTLNLWIGFWVDDVERGNARDISFYLGIYTAISVGVLLLESLVYVVYANGGWHASKKLHSQMISSVLGVSLDWFKNTPTGRIVNRLSRDLASVDNSLPRELQYVFFLFFQLILSMAAITSILPIFVLPGLLAVVAGLGVGEAYTRAAVIVKRLVQSSQSPVFSQFNDDMAGIQIIRARKDIPEAFGRLLATRLRDSNRSSATNFNLNRWVALRIDFATAIVTTLAGVIALSQVGIITAGLVGFSLQNATGLSSTILYLVRLSNELEVELQSFHRIKEYANLPAEDYAERESDSPEETAVVPINWPQTGAVEFRNVTVRYDVDGPDILKDINLTISAGERVAIVGRTGSGKSTLVLSLLRFTQVVKGQILYDGVDITHIARKRLRQGLTIIPQEAVLFNGTVRTNLAPAGDVEADILSMALKSCEGVAAFQFREQQEQAAEVNSTDQDTGGVEPSPPTEQTPLLAGVRNDNPAVAAVMKSASALDLDTAVDAKGENFSHGQRQVLSLCRALVRRSPLMLLDEATASMDFETDRGIQTVLRQAIFTSGSARTLVTIAHRLRTIADYDRVIVMGSGRVLESGSPRQLFNAKGSFYEMVQHSGELQELEAMFASF